MSSLRTVLFGLITCIAGLASTCDELGKLTLPKTRIDLARTARQDDADLSAFRRAIVPSTFCRVVATLTPSSDSDIKIELWLPENGWNGKYLAVGNGGWSGSINYAGLADGLTRGYATSSTDTGHKGGSAAFALGHPEKLIDYAYRSEHEMVVASKKIIAAYYSRQARQSYWNGCSAGGKQGLKEAQDYPEDFDGIVAGAPAANWVGRAVQSVWSAQAVHLDAASYIPPPKYLVIHKAVLEACDALDGVKDGVLDRPRQCAFDPKALECKGDNDANCLSRPQVEAAQKLYSWSINPRTGEKLYPGLEKGSELGWGIWAGPKPLAIGTDYFRFIVFEKPDWDYRTLNFDADVERARKLDGKRINALDPNLKPFFARGGKLIQYHGWGDPQIAPGNSVSYYESVVDTLGAKPVQDSYRLYMVPGMGHCGGGDGTSNFDMLPALEKWVEEKKAPEQIPAARVQQGMTTKTRPLCPYPQAAVYRGSGDTNSAENFSCRP